MPLAVCRLIAAQQRVLATAERPEACRRARRLRLELRRHAAAEGELHKLSKGGQRRARDEYGGGARSELLSSTRTPLAIVERGDSGEGAANTRDHVDGPDVRMLFHSPQTAAEALHDAERRLNVVVVAQVGGARARRGGEDAGRLDRVRARLV